MIPHHFDIIFCSHVYLIQVHVAYDDVWERRDVLGIHPQRQEGMFWVGACIPAGRFQAQDFLEFARVAET